LETDLVEAWIDRGKAALTEFKRYDEGASKVCNYFVSAIVVKEQIAPPRVCAKIFVKFVLSNPRRIPKDDA
jgi:hypothetical protein